MSNYSRRVLDLLNQLLRRANLKVDTLTSANVEQARLQGAEMRGVFEEPQYAVPPSFRLSNFRNILQSLPSYADRFASFTQAGRNSVGYQFDNEYFRSPDAEILYAIVRSTRPDRILEIGCGHSTKIIRAAITDGSFPCRHSCVDPSPRQDISRLADTIVTKQVETMDPREVVGSLKAGDILFIDTSHEVKPANDVAFIYGCILPILSKGVIVHIHDIFLPYEYPLGWVLGAVPSCGEQYIVHALLQGNSNWEVMWPGYYLQRTLPDFATHFPYLGSGCAQSLWLRKQG